MASIFKRDDRDNYCISYFDANGVRRERSSRTTDYRTAERIAAKIEADIALRRDGIIDARADRLTSEGRKPLTGHIDDYETYLKSKGVSERHRKQTRKRLESIMQPCGFTFLQDVLCTPIEQQLNLMQDAKRGTRTRNSYIASAKAFTAWCIKSGRLAADPLATLKRGNEAEDIRRKRRALTSEELERLLTVTELRPLAEYGRESVPKDLSLRKSKRDTWTKAPLTWENLSHCAATARETLRLKPIFLKRLEQMGRERRLIYTTLTLTGLRLGELRQLKWSALELAANSATITVDASTSKSGRTDTLPLRSDLAEMLRDWRSDCENASADSPVFHVSKDLLRAFTADLSVAGIERVDSAGRQVDLHALRHTTATHLAKSGVAPRAAQAIMRHSKLELTMQVYTDPRMLDLVGALNGLPELGAGSDRQERQRATGSLGPIQTSKSTCQQIRQQSGRFSQLGGARGRESASQCQRVTPAAQATNMARVSEAKRVNATTCENSGRRDSNAQHSAWKAEVAPYNQRNDNELQQLDSECQQIRQQSAPEIAANDSRLAELIGAWDELPEAVRAGIHAMVIATMKPS